MPRKPRTRRREKKFVPQGRAYVTATFNNTIITLTDPSGNAIAASSAGAMGFRGSRKSTAFAAQRAGDNAARQAMDQGLRTVDVFIKGAGRREGSGHKGASERGHPGREHQRCYSGASQRLPTSEEAKSLGPQPAP